MTKFAMTLNEIEPGQDKLACPTDCRFRTDQVGLRVYADRRRSISGCCSPECARLLCSCNQRLFELGRWDEAQTEKERLEDKQRAARRLREAGYATLAALACCCGGARH